MKTKKVNEVNRLIEVSCETAKQEIYESLIKIGIVIGFAIVWALLWYSFGNMNAHLTCLGLR